MTGYSGWGFGWAWAWGWHQGFEPRERAFYVGPVFILFEDTTP